MLNGTRATITSIDHTTDAIHALAEDKQIVIPRGYAEAGHLTHAYAMTFHKTQGMTAAETFILADDTLDRERAYTGLSRGTQRNSLYVVDPPDERAEERHAPEPVSDAVARARRALVRTTAKSLATEHLDRGDDGTAPIPHDTRRPQPVGPDLGPELGL